MKNKITLKTALYSLLQIPQQVNRIFGQEDEYKKIVKFILGQTVEIEDYVMPTIKKLEVLIGMKQYHLNKLVIEMYKSLVDNSVDFDYYISKTRIFIQARYNKTYTYFECFDLKHIPKTGDNFFLPFLRAKFNYDMFFVDRVYHSFYDDEHRIDISLKEGLYNSFWHHRLAEAKFKRELSFHDFFHSDEADIKEKLGYSRY